MSRQRKKGISRENMNQAVNSIRFKLVDVLSDFLVTLLNYSTLEVISLLSVTSITLVSRSITYADNVLMSLGHFKQL